MSRRPAAILLFAMLALAFPAGVLAAPGGAPIGPAPAAKLTIDVSKHVRILGKAQVKGTLSPFAADQKVVITYYQAGKQVARHRVTVRKKGVGGAFSDSLTVNQAGHYGVQATHEASAALGAASSLRKKFSVSVPGLHIGSHGPLVKAFKRALKRMGYDSGSGNGYSDRTGREVLAYRKVNNMSHNFHAGPSIVRDVLAGKGGYHVKHPGAGNHAEVPLSKQVLVLTRGDKPYGIYPVSTGKPSTPTVTGHFHFYRTQPGYNAEGMYYSFYFYGGYAVHGYASVPPNYPASHGCVRTYIADQPRIYDQLRYGESIFVF